MSSGSDLLRQAADALRRDMRTARTTHRAILLVVADWLEADAEALDDFENVSGAAFDTARTILQEKP